MAAQSHYPFPCYGYYTVTMVLIYVQVFSFYIVLVSLRVLASELLNVTNNYYMATPEYGYIITGHLHKFSWNSKNRTVAWVIKICFRGYNGKLSYNLKGKIHSLIELLKKKSLIINNIVIFGCILIFLSLSLRTVVL